ncbi:MAG TPA: HD domain-containing phosphohydrolase [Anaerolineales bacterium]|nr:HD domain-containing phosphohydrolase [Anaerolineales bacterium]HRQ91564.1 HD domain-containing phosphohydrolase [Anaerolineales bacterium]
MKPDIAAAVDIRLSEIVSALTYALDLTEGQPEGHTLRNCMIGMTLADSMDLSSHQRSALFYALLLKDLGCSSNAAKVSALFGVDDHIAKFRLKTVQWSSLVGAGMYVVRTAGEGSSLLSRLWRIVTLGLQGRPAARGLIKTRCERGADIARMLGFPEDTAQAILDLDEHWDGKGDPLGKKGEQISLLGRVLDFAQTLEVFYSMYGPEGARRVARERRGTWFDPALVDLFFATIADDESFWERLASKDLITDIGAYEPPDRILHADQDKLDQIAEAFARVIDAKSPYTSRHSARVAEIVRLMAAELKLPPEQRRDLSRAALLHDIGKLAVSNTILDKPDKLNDAEWAQMRSHTEYTYRILERVRGFRQLAQIASAHHERLDGRGYHRGLPGGEMPQEARLLAVADQYEALTAPRPYRSALTPQEALALLEKQVGTGIDPLAFQALQAAVQKGSVPDAAPVQPK